MENPKVPIQSSSSATVDNVVHVPDIPMQEMHKKDPCLAIVNTELDSPNDILGLNSSPKVWKEMPEFLNVPASDDVLHKVLLCESKLKENNKILKEFEEAKSSNPNIPDQLPESGTNELCYKTDTSWHRVHKESEIPSQVMTVSSKNPCSKISTCMDTRREETGEPHVQELIPVDVKENRNEKPSPCVVQMNYLDQDSLEFEEHDERKVHKTQNATCIQSQVFLYICGTIIRG